MIKASQREHRFSVRVTHPPGKYLLCKKSRYNVGSWDVLAGESHWGLSLTVALPHRSRPLSLKHITTEKACRCLRFGDSKPLFRCQEDEKRFLKNTTQWSFAAQFKGGFKDLTFFFSRLYEYSVVKKALLPEELLKQSRLCILKAVPISIV